MREIPRSTNISWTRSIAVHDSVPYMCGCLMAKGSQKLAVSVIVAYKVKLMNEAKLFYHFFKDPAGNYKESGTCQYHLMVTEQGEYGKSM